MAKQKPNLENIFSKTDPGSEGKKPAAGSPGPAPKRRRRDPNDRVSSMGVGLRASEWSELQRIADELGGVGLHPLVQFAIRDFIQRYNAGEVKPPTSTRAVIE